MMAPGAPGEGDLGGGIMDQWVGSYLSHTPIGQRPGELTLFIHYMLLRFIIIIIYDMLFIITHRLLSPFIITSY